MELDQDTKDTIIKEVTPIIASTAAAACVSAVIGELAMLVAINYKESSLAGDREIKPTDDETTISKSEVAAAESEGKVSHNGVNGQEGEVKAAETEALASTQEATAAESGASALRTKAGASDIETKALKMT